MAFDPAQHAVTLTPALMPFLSLTVAVSVDHGALVFSSAGSPIPLLNLFLPITVAIPGVQVLRADVASDRVRLKARFDGDPASLGCTALSALR